MAPTLERGRVLKEATAPLVTAAILVLLALMVVLGTD
jgi:hypothetical protein